MLLLYTYNLVSLVSVPRILGIVPDKRNWGISQCLSQTTKSEMRMTNAETKTNYTNKLQCQTNHKKDNNNKKEKACRLKTRNKREKITYRASSTR